MKERPLSLKFIFQKSNLKYRKIRIAKLLVFLPLIYLWCHSINRTKKILIEKLILIACYWNFYATKQNMKIKKISVIVVKDVVRDFAITKDLKKFLIDPLQKWAVKLPALLTLSKFWNAKRTLLSKFQQQNQENFQLLPEQLF